MKTTVKHIMIVAGEMSGDIHGAHLVQAIKQANPDIIFSGLGGPHLKEAGVKLYADLTKKAVIGFVEVLKHFGEIKKLFYLFLTKADEIKPDAVILVDYPGFNLRLAKKLKERGIKVLYYVSPQIWAWKEKRIKLIKQVTDRMMVFYKFEQNFYARRGVSVDFVGNPIIDHIEVTTSRHELLKSNGLNPELPTIGIVPGSREREIKTLLPPMIEAAKIIRKRIPKAQFIIPKTRELDPSLFNKHIHNLEIPIAMINEEFHNCVNACDACLVTSGTATLETALLEKPMVILYKTNWLTYLIGKMLVKIKWIGLANIIAQKEIVPECIQAEANGRTIAKKFLAFFEDPFKMESTINHLKDVRKKLGDPGASERAAKIVLSEI